VAAAASSTHRSIKRRIAHRDIDASKARRGMAASGAYQHQAGISKL